MRLHFACPLVFIVQYIGAATGYAYDTISLDRECGNVVTIACTTNISRSGTLQMAPFPDHGCAIGITLSPTCGGPNASAIYLNVRNLNVPEGHQLTISESNETLNPARLVLPAGPQKSKESPKSFAQLLSQFRSTPLFVLTYINGASSTNSSLVMDYSVLRSTKSASESYCRSLSGYLLTELICQQDDRVNCPASYSATSQLNPAAAIDDLGGPSSVNCGGSAARYGYATSHDSGTSYSSNSYSSGSNADRNPDAAATVAAIMIPLAIVMVCGLVFCIWYKRWKIRQMEYLAMQSRMVYPPGSPMAPPGMIMQPGMVGVPMQTGPTPMQPVAAPIEAVTFTAPRY